MRVSPYTTKRIFLENLEGYVKANRIIKPMGEWNK
jgi:hypothetical protein